MSLLAKETRCKLLDALRGWLEYSKDQSRKVGIVSFNFFCGASVGNDCQHHRGSCVAHAASAELGDLHDQAVPQELAAAEDELEVMWAEYEQDDIFVFQQGGGIERRRLELSTYSQFSLSECRFKCSFVL